MSKEFTRDFRLYKPNKNQEGAASAWQLSYKQNNKKSPWMMFLVISEQVGLDENKNASFDWDNAITVKLGVADIGEIMAVLENRKPQAGSERGLYHKTPDGTNKSIVFSKNDHGGYRLMVSHQDENKDVKRISHTITVSEGSVLLTLLRRAIEQIYGW